MYRDYIHIEDLCSAHALALSAIVDQSLRGANAFNLGNGKGFSVQEVIDAVILLVQEEGYDLTVEEGPRRLGDPAILVADSSLARETLGWKPAFADLATIINHAWSWEKKLAGL